MESHGNKPAPSFDAPLPIESHRNSDFLACLTQAIDNFTPGRKVLVAEAGLTDVVLSKVLSGMQGIPADLLDHLPISVKFDLMKRWGRTDGIEVREIDPAEINEQLVGLAREILRVSDLAARRGHR